MRKLILLVDDKETIAKVASIYLGKDYDIHIFSQPHPRTLNGYMKGKHPGSDYIGYTHAADDEGTNFYII